jgi:hypothetical protein
MAISDRLNSVQVGFGPDNIVVDMSEDAYAGDAQFTLSVDGQQIGGVQTVTASHAKGEQQAFIVNGTFEPGAHVLAVNFLNDAYGGTPDTDRNLWVDGVQAAGVTTSTEVPLYTGGPKAVDFAVPSVLVGNVGQYPTRSIQLYIAEDAYQGDAQFTVSVDGAQIGGVQTATVPRSSGQEQIFNVFGPIGPGPHNVTINFLNDLYGGTPATDRNLYVDRIDRGGDTIAVNQSLYFGGSATFSIGTNLFPTSPIPLGNGPDEIVLGISEDAYLGDAQFTVSVDGTPVGGVQTARVAHSPLQSQSFFALHGSFGAGPHAVAITFLNDNYGGSSATDRNLWVDSITYAGLTTSTEIGLFSNGTTTINVGEPTQVITGGDITGPVEGRAVLNGTPGNDIIVARGTGNFVNGNGGNDTVTGSAAGGDTILVGALPDGGTTPQEVVTISGTGNVVIGGDEAVSVSGNASATVVKLGEGRNTVSLDGAGNGLQIGNGTNTLTMTGGDATIGIYRQYGAVSPQPVQNYDDAITISGQHNSVAISVTLGKFVIGGQVTINGGSGFGTFNLGWGSATVHTDGPGNVVSFGAGTFDIAPGSGSDTVVVDGQQSTTTGAIHLAGDNNVVRAFGASVAISGGGGGGTYEFRESFLRGGPSSLVTNGPGNSVFQRNVEVAMDLGGGGDTVTLLGGKSSVVFHGSGDMLFLQPSEGFAGSPGTTSVVDNSAGLQISLDPGFGSVNVLDLDSTSVLHLLAGIGGFTTPDAAAAAVVYGASGINTLMLGNDSVVFSGAHLTANNFTIG